MLKILKNLKESWLSVLIIVALLCLQAAVDLELPNYKSKIVNEGIQSGGIENAAPKTINKNDMESILMFTEDDAKILNSYLLDNETELYEIKNLSKDEINELSNLMIEPIIISQTFQNEEVLKQMPEEQVEQMLQQATAQVQQMQDSIKQQAAISYVKNIYQNANVDTNKIQMNYIFIAGLKMLALAAISMASGITVMMLSSRVGARMARTLREKYLTK